MLSREYNCAFGVQWRCDFVDASYSTPNFLYFERFCVPPAWSWAGPGCLWLFPVCFTLKLASVTQRPLCLKNRVVLYYYTCVSVCFRDDAYEDVESSWYHRYGYYGHSGSAASSHWLPATTQLVILNLFEGYWFVRAEPVALYRLGIFNPSHSM
jgi:hypothetical protein